MCKIDDCEKNVFGRGMCSMHYFREKRTGSFDTFVEDLQVDDPEDFWQFVKKELGIA